MQIYNNSILIDSCEKKILSTNIYCKYIFRAKNRSKVFSVMIDNNSTFYPLRLKLKYFKKTFFKRLNISIGSSLNLKAFSYKKKIFSTYFNYYSFHSENKSFINYYIEKLHSLRSEKKSFFLVRIKKGGFTCIFNGIRGFLPRSHGNFLIKKIKFILNVKNKVTSLNSVFFFNFFQEKNTLKVRKVNKNLFLLINYLRNQKSIHFNLLSFLFYIEKKKLFVLSTFEKVILHDQEKNFFSNKTVLKRNHQLMSLFSKNFVLPKNLYTFVYFNIKLSQIRTPFRKKIIGIKKNRKFVNKFLCKFIFLAFLKKKYI